jgi:hypothetical protein
MTPTASEKAVLYEIIRLYQSYDAESAYSEGLDLLIQEYARKITSKTLIRDVDSSRDRESFERVRKLKVDSSIELQSIQEAMRVQLVLYLENRWDKRALAEVVFPHNKLEQDSFIADLTKDETLGSERVSP